MQELEAFQRPPKVSGGHSWGVGRVLRGQHTIERRGNTCPIGRSTAVPVKTGLRAAHTGGRVSENVPSGPGRRGFRGHVPRAGQGRVAAWRRRWPRLDALPCRTDRTRWLRRLGGGRAELLAPHGAEFSALTLP